MKSLSNRTPIIMGVLLWCAGACVFGALVAEAGDYRVRKSAEGLTFDVSINRNPPVQGKNEIRVAIKNSAGNPQSDAEVVVNYYMPPMPNMPPMNYTVPAERDGGEYRAVMDLIMAGPWNIIVRSRCGGRWLRVNFPIDVR